MRVLQILDLYDNGTAVRVRIYHKYIKPQIGCSYNAFNRMLNVINPARELEEIEEQIKELSSEDE
jgi:hypothetical protein